MTYTNQTTEANFDGLVGPTHHYAGLSYGNEASARHQHQPSNPLKAVKQGLAKMKALADQGFVQGVIPPLARPDIALLRQAGFSGSDQQVLSAALRHDPALLSAASSASSMWVANAATVSPSADTADRRVHFTVANLNNKLHRMREAPQTERVFKAMFADEHHFQIHQALPQSSYFGDEGAANHNCLTSVDGSNASELFVYGRDERYPAVGPQRYPARQTLQASQAVARLHQLDPTRTFYVQQTPEVIDQGVFHNDVIAVSHREVLFCHQQAFVDQDGLFARLRRAIPGFTPLVVPAQQVSVADAVNTYLFNSQLLSRADGNMVLVLPQEAREHDGVWLYLQQLLAADNPIAGLQVYDLRESMRNGGGPACLRLRVAMTPEEQRAVAPGVMLNDQLFTTLNQWADRFYRDSLHAEDLADPQLLADNYQALDELTRILGLGSIYDFQQL